MTTAPPEAQSRLNLAASAYLDATREFLRANYGSGWDHFPDEARQAATISSAVQTLLLPAAQGTAIMDIEMVFSNIGMALGVHTAHLPDADFTALMGALAMGAGQGRAHRVATVMNWQTVGGVQ